MFPMVELGRWLEWRKYSTRGYRFYANTKFSELICMVAINQNKKMFRINVFFALYSPELVMTNPCSAHPCLNNGTCIDDTNRAGMDLKLINALDFRCFCPIGYSGIICESKTDKSSCTYLFFKLLFLHLLNYFLIYLLLAKTSMIFGDPMSVMAAYLRIR